MSEAAGPRAGPEDRRFDVVVLGRLGVDLYAEQLGAPLEHATSFARYLGGSSANIAVGCARLGLRTALASRVGDDAMGRFLLETLAAEGVDASHVPVDSHRLTALVLLGIQDRDTFPHIFYREHCADMAIEERDVAEEFIASARALVITGTHFSTEHTHRISTLALDRARRNGVRTVLDVDYRPVLWGLTAPGAGAQRFVASDRVTAHLQEILPRFDLVVGTEDEFHIAGGDADPIASLRRVRSLTPAVLVVKLGAGGCAIIEGPIPARLEDAPVLPGFPVKVMNLLGAGDAFLSGLLKGWLTGVGWAEAGRVANACGALVVSRHACSESMPSPAELEWFLSRPGLDRPDLDPTLRRLHRVTTRRRQWPELHVFAFDHRTQFRDLAREVGAPEARLRRLKSLLVDAVGEAERTLALSGRVGALIDDTYGEDALLAAGGRGWWLGRPVEVPGSSPLEFEGGRSIGTRLVTWPREQVVKCLVRFHPDAPEEHRREDEAQLRALQDAVHASGHELLLEVIPSRRLPVGDDAVIRALRRLYDLGITPEWWKLAPLSREAWGRVDALLAERDPWCRGVVILGLEATVENLAVAFRDAAGARSCRGFVVGRTISHEPARAWLAGELDDAGLIAQVVANFAALVRAWRDARRPAARGP
jgi:5-dehydro-2-deoxygluconokinase